MFAGNTVDAQRTESWRYSQNMHAILFVNNWLTVQCPMDLQWQIALRDHAIDGRTVARFEKLLAEIERHNMRWNLWNVNEECEIMIRNVPRPLGGTFGCVSVM